MRFRKKPVVIEAVLWSGKNLNDVSDLVGGADHVRKIGDELRIRTLEGTMICRPGDWLIKGTKGEFYPCKPDIFEETYERV